MKPKVPKSENKTSSDSSRPKSSSTTKQKTNRLSKPRKKIKQKSALDHVQRSSSKRRLNTIISERNKALNSLTEIESKYEKLFSVHSDGVLIFDSETSLILDANDSACKLFGYSKEEFMQLTIPEISAEPEQTLAQLEKVTNEEITKIPLRYIKPKFGNNIATEITTGIFQIKSKKYVFAIYRDITQQINYQETLKRKSLELEKSNQALKDFVSIASHDLQAPIRKIIAFSSRLEETNLDFPQGSKEYLERIQKVALRMQNLLGDLLAFSQVSSHSETFQKVDLKAILDEVLEDLDVSQKKLKENIKIGSLPQVEAHVPQMRQLFQNLISNSIKFHKQGVAPEIEIQGKPTNTGHWEIIVKDRGIGFDEKYLDLIFRPFERLHGINEFEGTGMGLAICKKIVERHGGQITAKSQPNQGASFIFTLQNKTTPA